MILWPFFDDVEETAFHPVCFTPPFLDLSIRRRENFCIFFDYIESSWRGRKSTFDPVPRRNYFEKGVFAQELAQCSSKEKANFLERGRVLTYICIITQLREAFISLMDGEYMYIVRIQTVLTTREIDSVVQLLLLLLMSLIWNIYIYI